MSGADHSAINSLLISHFSSLLSHLPQWGKGGIHMSAHAIEDILRRAQTDESFRDELQHRPDAALHGYDIEYDERQALISGDAARLRELGVDADLALMADAYN